MFEQGLTYLFKTLLGEYVEDGISLQEKIQVGVWSGFIVLENLVLKNSILALLVGTQSFHTFSILDTLILDITILLLGCACVA
jgi:hypothetical protein